MMRYFDMKQCFDVCGDEDIPFVEGLYNDERELTKKIATKHHHYPSFEASWSHKWQIQRMYICQGCGKYFKSEDCESISGSGTFNCDECNHPEPKVLTAEESYEKNWKGMLRTETTPRESYKVGFNKGIESGKLAEYQRPEQVEMREAIKNWDSGKDKYGQAILTAFKNLKPPT